MSCESSTLPHQGALLGQQWRAFAADELIRRWLSAVRVDLAWIAHVPCPHGLALVVGSRFTGRRQLGSLRVESVAVVILRAPDGRIRRNRICHVDRVVGPVNVRVHPQTEQMLVVVCIHAGIDLGSPAMRILTLVHAVRVEDAGELDLGLDGAVLVEDPLDRVFVVGSSEDLLDNKLSRPSHDG